MHPASRQLSLCAVGEHALRVVLLLFIFAQLFQTVGQVKCAHILSMGMIVVFMSILPNLNL